MGTTRRGLRALMVLLFVLLIAIAGSSQAIAASDGKVYVCKYVGTPGDDERLQTGQNPIEVSVNAIPGDVVIGAYFADAQGRSFVLASVPQDPEPSASDCPGGPQPSNDPSPEPNASVAPSTEPSTSPSAEPTPSVQPTSTPTSPTSSETPSPTSAPTESPQSQTSPPKRTITPPETDTIAAPTADVTASPRWPVLALAIFMLAAAAFGYAIDAKHQDAERRKRRTPKVVRRIAKDD